MVIGLNGKHKLIKFLKGMKTILKLERSAPLPFGLIFSCPSPPQQYMLFLFLVGAVSAILAWENRGHRTCVLDVEKTQYMCVIGEHSVETGNFHNVYIRLKAQKHGKPLLQSTGDCSQMLYRKIPIISCLIPSYSLITTEENLK